MRNSRFFSFSFTLFLFSLIESFSQSLELTLDVDYNTMELTNFIPAGQNGWLLAGDYYPSGSINGRKGVLVRIDESGNKLWDFYFEGDLVSVEAVAKMSTGDFIVVTSEIH
jgi:hypothetical protein